MKRWLMTAGLAVIVLSLCVVAASSRPDEDDPPKKKGPRAKRGRPGDDDLPPRDKGKFKRKGFTFHLLPPHVADELELTKDQQKKFDALEKETREKLFKILTAAQKKTLQTMRAPRRPPPPPPPGGDDDEDRPPPPPRGKKPPPKEKEDEQVGKAGGIQWYSTLKSGLAASKLTGQPILLVSAAPHCAGVSGIW